MVPSPDLSLVAQLLEILMADLVVDIPICLPKFLSRVMQDFSYQQQMGSMISHVFCLAFPWRCFNVPPFPVDGNFALDMFSHMD